MTSAGLFGNSVDMKCVYMDSLKVPPTFGGAVATVILDIIWCLITSTCVLAVVMTRNKSVMREIAILRKVLTLTH
jgi:hypothetical protein